MFTGNNQGIFTGGNMSAEITVEKLYQPLDFGKYKGKKLIYVLLHEISYTEWMLENIHVSTALRELLIAIEDVEDKQQYIADHYQEYLDKERRIKRVLAGDYDSKKSRGGKTQQVPVAEAEAIVKLLFDNTKKRKLKWVKDYSGNDKKKFVTEYHGRKYTLFQEVKLDKETLHKEKVFYLESDGMKRIGNKSLQELSKVIVENAVELSYEARHQEEVQQWILQNGEIAEGNKVDLFVRGNINYCCKNHATKDVAVEFLILNKKSLKITKYIDLACYCRDCDAYFILDETYEYLKSKGIILHQIIAMRQFVAKSYLNRWSSDSFEEESILHQWGYNVGREDNLSDEVRWAILEYLVDNKIVDGMYIANLLNGFIKVREGRPSMEVAISKWGMDMQHISAYTAKKVNGFKTGRIYN